MNNAPVELNVDQQNAVDGFFSFLMSGETKMALIGAGGVGKTFVMSRLIDEVIPRYQQMCELMNIPVKYTDVVMTATTNKAAEVLAQATGRPAQTIHSYLNLKVFNDIDSGETKLDRNKNWTVHTNTVIFLDEASMADFNLLKELDEATINCKIVFVGDACQLAPVKCDSSPAFNVSTQFELTIPMRTDKPELLALNESIRQFVKHGTLPVIQLAPGIIDHLSDAELQTELDSKFLDKHANHRIMAYTNKRVGDYNKYIRYVRNLSELYTEGEELISNSAVQINRNCRLSVEQEVTIRKRFNVVEETLPDGSTLDVVGLEISTGYDGIQYINAPVDMDHFNSLIKYYKSIKLWSMFYHLKEKYPDLRPKDACTFHKAQGSSYDVAYIDLTNLSTCNVGSMAARMLYVAVSRARHRVVFYGNLAEKYGTIQQ